MIPYKKYLLISLSLPLFIKAMTTQELSLEEKVGQLLMVSVQAESANEMARALINDLHVSGIIYYSWANGLHSAEQVTKLSTGLQDLASQTRTQLPLIIAIDHEGGRVHRFIQGFTHFPPPFAYALTGNPSLTEQCAHAMGAELSAAGITMNLAPVVDVLSNFSNPIGTRAFGTTQETVTKHADAFIEGLHKAGIATSIKHFPGHGDTTTDSHLALPVIDKTMPGLAACELAPFYALAKKTDSIMTGHLMVPAIDKATCSTLSKTTLDLLRKQAHFDGIIISDSLVMQGVTTLCKDLSDAAIQAFNAGCDILLVGGHCLVGTTLHEVTYDDIAQIHTTLVAAVQNGVISRKRLDSAVTRILLLKNKPPLTSSRSQTMLETAEHRNLSFTVATRALNTLRTSNRALPSTVHESLHAHLSSITEMYHEDATHTCLH